MSAMADILFAQLGLNKDEIVSLAYDAANVIKSVDARLSAMEENQRRIMQALNIEPVEVPKLAPLQPERNDPNDDPTGRQG